MEVSYSYINSLVSNSLVRCGGFEVTVVTIYTTVNFIWFYYYHHAIYPRMGANYDT